MEAQAVPRTSSLQGNGLSWDSRKFLWNAPGAFSEISKECCCFSEISDDCSEMNEEKGPQEPSSTPPSIVHGKDEGLQVSESSPQELGSSKQVCIATKGKRQGQ